MDSNAIKRKFQRKLLAWYARHKRDLPWRKTRDPYKILVSEVMLQQTPVDRVKWKYQEFLQKYPSVQTLAKANPQAVRKDWYPLGYNARPYRLQAMAREAVEKYDGKIPGSYDALISMDGIGRYTAGAVLSFAFQKDAPTLDTNVARLLQRIFLGVGAKKSARHQKVPGTFSSAALEKKLWQLAEWVIPKGKGYIFNQAMMDFGAMVCTARKPLCLTCCMGSFCRSYGKA